jgi:hypothetical protein
MEVTKWLKPSISVRDIGEPPGTGRADDDSDFGSLLHRCFPIHLRLVSNDVMVTLTCARRHFFRGDLPASK